MFRKKDQKRYLLHTIEPILKRRNAINRLCKRYSTPFYVYDRQSLDDSIESFTMAFKKEIPSFKTYYAVKINHHPLIVRRVVQKGLGLDVASPREIDIAVDAGCNDIVYFSPGKTESDLVHALKYSDVVIIHMDSFGELEMLGRLTNKSKKRVRAGIRIHTDSYGDWKKYGIHLSKLKSFFEQAQKYPFIELQGIHFHSSRNKDSDFYENTIKELGSYLKKHFNAIELKKIRHIDFGGGFEVYKSEGRYQDMTTHDTVRVLEAIVISQYARKIGKAIRVHLNPLIDAVYYSEPGRIICNNAMHIVLSVADVKDKENVILDGGVNMVGWQRFETEYFPLIDISSVSRKEIRCNVWGNLCTTWDIWGYYCYARKILKGDIIVVPNQGALTYSLAQHFIQPIPPVYRI